MLTSIWRTLFSNSSKPLSNASITPRSIFLTTGLSCSERMLIYASSISRLVSLYFSYDLFLFVFYCKCNIEAGSKFWKIYCEYFFPQALLKHSVKLSNHEDFSFERWIFFEQKCGSLPFLPFPFPNWKKPKGWNQEKGVLAFGCKLFDVLFCKHPFLTGCLPWEPKQWQQRFGQLFSESCKQCRQCNQFIARC